MRPGLEVEAQRSAKLLRALLGACGVAGAMLLALATNSTIINVTIGTTGETASGLDTALSGADRHGPALIIIGVFALIMLAGGLRGARPAMLAIAAGGVVVLAIAIVSDARSIDDIGAIRQLYTGAMAGAGSGFYYETLGGALLLICGGGLLVLAGGEPVAAPSKRPPPRRTRKPAVDPPAPPPPPGRAADDWFAD